LGCIRSRDWMPARALRKVRASSISPSVMMNATSPAAKISPMATAAIMATLTSIPARMLPVVKNLRKA